MHIGSVPVVSVATFIHALLEVVKETLLALAAIKETELFIDNSLSSTALYKLCLLKDAPVVLNLKLFNGISVDVKSQILTARQPAGLGIADRWIEIQIE